MFVLSSFFFYFMPTVEFLAGIFVFFCEGDELGYANMKLKFLSESKIRAKIFSKFADPLAYSPPSFVNNCVHTEKN